MPIFDMVNYYEIENAVEMIMAEYFLFIRLKVLNQR